MSRILFSVYCFLLFAGWQVSVADGAAGQRKEKLHPNPKLQRATKDIKQLKRQLERATKEIKRLKRQLDYIKTEVKGVIRYETFSVRFGEPSWSYWTITGTSFKWQLDIGLNKQLLKMAQKHKGKTVVLTGFKSTRPGSFYSGPIGFGQTTVFVVTAIKAAQK